MNHKKTRIAYTLVSIGIAAVGFATGQTWLYAVSLAVTSVGILTINNKNS